MQTTPMGDTHTWFPVWKYPTASRITELNVEHVLFPGEHLMPFNIPVFYSLLILSRSFLKLIAPQLHIALVTPKSSEQLHTGRSWTSSLHGALQWHSHPGSCVFVQGTPSKEERKRRGIWLLTYDTCSAQAAAAGGFPWHLSVSSGAVPGQGPPEIHTLYCHLRWNVNAAHQTTSAWVI